MARRDSKFFRVKQSAQDAATQTVEDEAFAALERGEGKRALELFEKLAALGAPVACYCVGDIYLHGQGGVPFNPAEAKKWFEKSFASSVERVSQYAAIKLGYIYGAGYGDDNRHGVAVNYEKAFEYLKRLEDSDIPVGLLRLGICYETGMGTAQDRKKAMALYQRASKLGHVIALKHFAALKVKTGSVPLGLSLWILAIIEGFALAICTRNNPRLAML